MSCDPRAACVGEHLVDLAFRLGVGVEELDVDAVEQEAGCPSTTDHAAPEQPDVRDAELLGRGAAPPCRPSVHGVSHA